MSPFMSELVGTFLLVLLGDGVVANCLLKKTKGYQGGWIVITTAWAFAVFIGVVVAQPSGAHLNPAVTLGLAVGGKFAWTNVIPYIVAQMIGGFLGAFLMYIVYIDHFKITEDAALRRACFCTESEIRHYRHNVISEIVGTFVLVFAVFYLVGAQLNPAEATAVPIGLGSIGALPVAIVVWVIGLSLGGTTGYAINPARDTAPRLALTLLSKSLKTSPDWAYGWIPLCAPMIGGVLAAGAYLILG